MEPALDAPLTRPSAEPAASVAAPARTALRSPALVGAVVVFLVAAVIPAGNSPWAISGLLRSSLITALAIPLVLLAFRPGRWVVAVALIACLAPVTMQTMGNFTNHDFARQRNHDGGVFATRAAAQDVLDGRNPYAQSFTDDIPSYWNPLYVRDGKPVTNPLVQHYPYLPGFFLVQAPFLAASNAVGVGWDPRVLYLAVLALTAIVIALLKAEPWQRASMLLALGCSFTTLYTSWGANDAMVACGVLLAVLLGARHPKWAGVALALAVSTKFLVLIGLVPLGIVLWRRGGWSEVKRWWTFPAVLAATCLPFFVAGPKAFLDDTLFFNLGLTKLRYPTSGMGLPLTWPGLFHGPVLGLTTLLLGVAAIAVPAWAAWRRPTFAVVAVGTAFGIWALIEPARTFQQHYLTMLIVLGSAGWLLVGGTDRTLDDDPVLAGSTEAEVADDPLRSSNGAIPAVPAPA